MPVVTLPDGKQLKFSEPVTIQAVAETIGTGLAKAAVAAKVDDQLVDISHIVDKNVTLQILRPQDPEGLEIIRHSTAHLLAQAVKRLYPKAKLAIGPVTEDGFYYDIDCPTRLSEDDLPDIEATMQAIVKENLSVKRFTMSRDEAIEYYRAQNEPYKIEILHDVEDAETVSFYQQGEFVDLCRGPHAPTTGHLKAFKLMKLAGAYWRGDASRPMLQRIYGTAWPDKKALNDYLKKLEEAVKRDHRRLAKKMALFHIQEEAPGMIFWHPRGWTLYRLVKDYIRQKLDQYGYQEINTPMILARHLWEESGHWAKFEDDMFLTHSEEREFLIKPMNCPCHVQVFNQGIKSYRDLPIRLAEFGSCHRNEPSGTLHGLLRLRNFVQDDAHIFCTPEQMSGEILDFIQLLQEVYQDFGFDDMFFYLSTRPEQRIGSDQLWDKAEHALQESLEKTNLSWTLHPGEGAFYGPKIEFSLRDCLGRLWQCGTIQVDFFTPDRLGAVYVTEDGSKKPPVMLHRAILGSIERFVGILLEEYAGDLPLWLAPVQVAVLNIADRHAAYCKQIAETLKAQNLRIDIDLRNEKIGYKIREHTIKRVPYLLIVGDQEVDRNEVAIRTQQGEDLGSMTVEHFIQQVAGEIRSRAKGHEINRGKHSGKTTENNV